MLMQQSCLHIQRTFVCRLNHHLGRYTKPAKQAFRVHFRVRQSLFGLLALAVTVGTFECECKRCVGRFTGGWMIFISRAEKNSAEAERDNRWTSANAGRCKQAWNEITPLLNDSKSDLTGALARLASPSHQAAPLSHRALATTRALDQNKNKTIFGQSGRGRPQALGGPHHAKLALCQAGPGDSCPQAPPSIVLL